MNMVTRQDALLTVTAAMLRLDEITFLKGIILGNMEGASRPHEFVSMDTARATILLDDYVERINGLIGLILEELID